MRICARSLIVWKCGRRPVVGATVLQLVQPRPSSHRDRVTDAGHGSSRTRTGGAGGAAGGPHDRLSGASRTLRARPAAASRGASSGLDQSARGRATAHPSVVCPVTGADSPVQPALAPVSRGNSGAALDTGARAGDPGPAAPAAGAKQRAAAQIADRIWLTG